MTVRGPKIEVELQRYSSTDDGMGGYTQDWSGVRKITGVLVALNDTERMGPGMETVYSTHDFFCDYQVGLVITEKDRLRFGDRIFDIQSTEKIKEKKAMFQMSLLEVEAV